MKTIKHITVIGDNNAIAAAVAYAGDMHCRPMYLEPLIPTASDIKWKPWLWRFWKHAKKGELRRQVMVLPMDEIPKQYLRILKKCGAHVSIKKVSLENANG